MELTRRALRAAAVLFVNLPLIVYAQSKAPAVQWEKTFAGSGIAAGRSVAESRDGDFVVAGWTAGPALTNVKAYLVRTTSTGELVWEQKYGERDGVNARSIAGIADGGYIIAGSTGFLLGDAVSDVYLLRIDEEGGVVWQKTFGEQDARDYGNSAQETRADGGFIAAGYSVVFHGAHTELYLIKIDADGDLEWEKRLDGFGGTAARTVRPLAAGGYGLGGTTRLDGPGAVGQHYLARTDHLGEIVWQKQFQLGTGSVFQEVEDGFVFAGRALSIETNTAGTALIKTNGSGDELWARTFDHPKDSVDSLEITRDRGFVLAGISRSSDDSMCETRVMKVDGDGSLIWHTTLEQTDSGNCRAFATGTKDGGYIVTGGADGQLYLVRLESEIAFIRGDTDGSGGVSITDAITTLERLFSGGPPIRCRDAADLNDDGRIDISDAISTLVFLFSDGFTLADPYPNCGEDPTVDSLDCSRPRC